MFEQIRAYVCYFVCPGEKNYTLEHFQVVQITVIGLCRLLLLYIEKWFSVVQTNMWNSWNLHTLFASSSLHPANSISLSHKTNTSQPAVFFSHKKSAPATSTSQPNTVLGDLAIQALRWCYLLGWISYILWIFSDIQKSAFQQNLTSRTTRTPLSAEVWACG